MDHHLTLMTFMTNKSLREYFDAQFDDVFTLASFMLVNAAETNKTACSVDILIVKL